MRIVRRDSYAIDLDKIVDHIALDNPLAALNMWDEIERQVERLRDFPRSGRTGRMPETRGIGCVRDALHRGLCSIRRCGVSSCPAWRAAMAARKLDTGLAS
ncbi:type II toxin-antitoxin system RelE/ParE family toxin [Rhizobium beringeri]